MYSAYASQPHLFPQASYQISQPTTPVNVPTPLDQPFGYGPDMGMSDGYSPALDYVSHFPNLSYPSRNVPLIRLDTSFPPVGVSPVHLTGSSGTPSTFNTPIHPLRHISPFTNSPTSPLPQLSVSLPSVLFPLTKRPPYRISRRAQQVQTAPNRPSGTLLEHIQIPAALLSRRRCTNLTRKAIGAAMSRRWNWNHPLCSTCKALLNAESPFAMPSRVSTLG